MSQILDVLGKNAEVLSRRRFVSRHCLECGIPARRTVDPRLPGGH
jgi:phosphoribosyl-dephospho-CoA transferase